MAKSKSLSFRDCLVQVDIPDRGEFPLWFTTNEDGFNIEFIFHIGIISKGTMRCFEIIIGPLALAFAWNAPNKGLEPTPLRAQDSQD